MDKLFGRFDAASLRQRFASAGVFDVLAERGFSHPDVEIVANGQALPHVYVTAQKHGRRHLLLEACLTDAVVRPSFFTSRGYAIDESVTLAVAYWVREQDPTRSFPADRPQLPLQRHPGLGALRHAFRVIAGMAAELGKDGVACVPKFFHDALIFYRSRLFLFLDPIEQARFEVLMRDLAGTSLRDLSLALLNGAVTDQHGLPVAWHPGYQVFPLSQRLTAYFNSPKYETMVVDEAANYRVAYDPRLGAAAHLHVEISDLGEIARAQRH
jgi:hypothetical protein